MSMPNTISTEKLARLIGTPACPAIVDVRTDEDVAADSCLIPGARRLSYDCAADWAAAYGGRTVVVVCHRGLKLSHGVAAWLRHEGVSAEALEGGMVAWTQAGLPVVRMAALPPLDESGRTLWVTRARPKVDRIACPWLIRRFVDSDAVFLFVPPTEVAGVVERFGATPFDVEGVAWSHEGDLCTFDVMVRDFGLGSLGALGRLATIVRGADTGRPELVPQAAGLLAASLGLSRMYADDLEQLEAGMTLYDAFYRWCRDAVEETHDWASHKPRGGRS